MLVGVGVDFDGRIGVAGRSSSLRSEYARITPMSRTSPRSCQTALCSAFSTRHRI